MKAASRSSWRRSPISARASCGRGRIWSASAAASAFSAAPARASSRSTAASSPTASCYLKRELETVRRTRALHREARKRVPYPVVALVGYTNAGKSTLVQPPDARRGRRRRSRSSRRSIRPCGGCALPSGRSAILSDTVGFISDLPTPSRRRVPRHARRGDRGRSHRPCPRHASSRQRGAARRRARRARPSSASARRSSTASIEALNKIDLLPAGAARRAAATRHGAIATRCRSRRRRARDATSSSRSSTTARRRAARGAARACR